MGLRLNALLRVTFVATDFRLRLVLDVAFSAHVLVVVNHIALCGRTVDQDAVAARVLPLQRNVSTPYGQKKDGSQSSLLIRSYQ